MACALPSFPSKRVDKALPKRRSQFTNNPLPHTRRRENPRAQLAPIATRNACPEQVTSLGCLSRLAETSRSAAKYRIDLVACALFIE